MTDGRRGMAQALAAAALFGASAPLAKILVSHASAQLLAGLLYLGSGLGLAAVRAVFSHGPTRLRRRDLSWLAGAIVAGGVLGPVALMFGLKSASASGASLLLNLESVFTATIAWVVFRENVDRRVGLGFLAIVAGGALLAWPGSAAPGSLAGAALVAAACLCWAVDNNLTQKVSGADATAIAMLKGLVAGSVNLGLAVGFGAVRPGFSVVASALCLGFVSYGVSLVLFVLALRSLGTARTSAYFASAPFVGAALSLVVLHEPLTGALVASAALMAFGLWLHVSERHDHVHTHEPLEHDHPHVHDDHHRHDHGPGDGPAAPDEPHAHRHVHDALSHAHPHFPDLHHRHRHE